MNNFIIAVGTYSAALTQAATVTATKIGTVTVNKGDTACKAPDALTYIKKATDKNAIGKKKKTLKC